MKPNLSEGDQMLRAEEFLESLSSFSRLHKAQRWEGTFGDFLKTILPSAPQRWRERAISISGT